MGADPPTQHPGWEDGDFESISSDNVKFCVLTYNLFALFPRRYYYAIAEADIGSTTSEAAAISTS